MKLCKRITGLVLACLLVVGMVPANVLADTVTYTGLDVRVYNTNVGDKIQDAKSNIQYATDEMSAIHKPDNSVNVSGKWYHTVDTLDNIPAAEQSAYTPYTYDTYNVYAREVGADERFVKDEQYLFVADLTPTTGSFDAVCLFGPIGSVYANITTRKATVYVPVIPTEGATIDWINFTCTNDGNITITDSNHEYVYLYTVDDGGEFVDGLHGEPVGKRIINNAEYQPIKPGISVANTPHITLYAVSADEWDNNRTSAVLAYGDYTIPMSDPYIEVDTLVFGEYITVTEIGTTTGGKYHPNTAFATFEGWFTDKEGKNPATVEADAYAIFNLRSYSLFDPDITASDFMLKCENERYVGEYLLPKTESNAYKIAFFVPSNRISFTLEVIGEGASMSFIGEDRTSISMRPLESGKYESKDVYISIAPGFYAKSLKVNGVEWDDIRNPFKPSANMQIPNDENYTAGIPSFEPTEDTVITLEVAPADRITINYGDNKPAYVDRYADEAKWHANGQYWVSETSTTELCIKSAIIDPTYTKHLKELNTKPDGSGISIPAGSTHFYWKPIAEYQNGKSDEITLYAIMECNAHIEYGAEDNAWEYRDAKPASCTETGHIAHRYCPNCGQYQVKNEETGAYEISSFTEVTTEKLPHEHNQYTTTSDTIHTVKCENCTDSFTEEHKLENGVCICGYRTYIKGDMNKDGYVTDADAVYLLYYTIFEEDYPIQQPADFNGDGYVTDADAVYLLYYTIFPEDYPLN